MTGPDHYQAGEALLAAAEGQPPAEAALTVAKAQAHLTAAGVAATALTAIRLGDRSGLSGPDADSRAWWPIADTEGVPA